jgi:putative endonuclease
MMDRIAIGQSWEDEAESFLQKNGLKSLKRNYRCRMGEIDLVMRDRECLVFAEVRFRKSGSYGSGAASITHAKRQKLIRTAAYFLRTEGVSSHQACRFDVVSIGQSTNDDNSSFEIEWIRNAFQADN